MLGAQAVGAVVTMVAAGTLWHHFPAAVFAGKNLGAGIVLIVMLVEFSAFIFPVHGASSLLFRIVFSISKLPVKCKPPKSNTFLPAVSQDTTGVEHENTNQLLQQTKMLFDGSGCK
jgi:hypothetical protein